MTELLTKLSVLLHSGEISSLELTEKYIAETEKKNPVYNAYVHTCFEKARADAKRADEMLKKGLGGSLCGIPMAIKDNICTDGIETTCCSKILEGYKPYYNATVVEKLYNEGAVMLGKTNMDEFAMGSTSESSCYGAPLNPRNTSYVTGGSSGGSAAAVGAGIAPYALGSDTGGSIRQPASFCGIVGLKPTYGAVSRYGLIAYGSSLDQIGPLTASVKDAAIVYDAIKGHDKRDMTSRQVSDEPVEKSIDGNVKGLKIGIAKEYFEGIDSEIKSLIYKAVDYYSANGAEIIDVSIPALKDSLPVYYIIACAEASSNLGRYDGIRYGFRAKGYTSVDDMVYKTRSEGFGREVKKRIMLGTYVLSSGYYDAYYKKACIIRNEIKKSFAEVFEKCDVILAPTAPNTAFPSGLAKQSPLEMYLSDIATVPVNIAGLPAVSIPVGTDKNGLPAGMQIIGNAFDEKTVLNAAYAFERSNNFSEFDIPEIV